MLKCVKRQEKEKEKEKEQKEKQNGRFFILPGSSSVEFVDWTLWIHTIFERITVDV